MDDSVEMIQVDLPEIDREALLARIQENLRLHKLVGPPSFPVFEVMSSTGGGASHTSASSSLEFDLHQAFDAYGEAWVSVDVPEGDLPLLGRLKRVLHELIVYYVNQLAERQMRFNAALLRIIDGRRSECHSDQAALRREIAQLRERVERLERQQEEPR